MAAHARAGPRAGPPAPRAGAENHQPPAAGLSVAALERLARERRRALLHAAAHRSRCAQDAEDAVQEALRIAFERRASIRPATAFAYIAVIAMHEASRLARIVERTRSLDAPAHTQEPPALVECQPAPARDVDAVLDALDGLRAVKPDEARALMARALGWRYAEIADAFGWSYTKSNRCLAEGRAALRGRSGG